MPRDRDAQVGALGIAMAVAAGLLLVVAEQHGARSADDALHDALAVHRLPAVTAIALGLHVVGGTPVMSLVAVVVSAALWIAGRPAAGVAIALSVAATSTVSSLLKVVVARPRPPDGLVDMASASFPSGHTALAAAFGVGIALLVGRVWVWVLAVAWIVLMAASRTYLLVHWLSDVTAGALLGAAVALVVASAAAGLGAAARPGRVRRRAARRAT